MESPDGLNRVVSMRVENIDPKQVGITLRHGLAKIGQCCMCGNEILLSRTSTHKIEAGFKPTCMQCCGYEQKQVLEMIYSGKVKMEKSQIEDAVRFMQIEAAEDAENN